MHYTRRRLRLRLVLARFLLTLAITLDQVAIVRREGVEDFDLLFFIRLARDDDVPESRIFFREVAEEVINLRTFAALRVQAPDFIRRLQRRLNKRLETRVIIGFDIIGASFLIHPRAHGFVGGPGVGQPIGLNRKRILRRRLFFSGIGAA